MRLIFFQSTANSTVPDSPSGQRTGLEPLLRYAFQLFTHLVQILEGFQRPSGRRGLSSAHRRSGVLRHTEHSCFSDCFGRCCGAELSGRSVAVDVVGLQRFEDHRARSTTLLGIPAQGARRDSVAFVGRARRQSVAGILCPSSSSRTATFHCGPS